MATPRLTAQDPARGSNPGSGGVPPQGPLANDRLGGIDNPLDRLDVMAGHIYRCVGTVGTFS